LRTTGKDILIETNAQIHLKPSRSNKKKIPILKAKSNP